MTAPTTVPPDDLPTELAQPAGAVSRAAALITDLILTSITASAIGVGLNALGIVFTVPDDVINRTIGYLAFTSLLFVLYCTVSWTLFGQTIGKLLFGLRVVLPDGRNPNVARSLVRALAYGLSAIFCIGFAMVLVTRDRRALHDYIAGTFVVYAWPARPRALTQLRSTEQLVPETEARRP